MPKLSLKSLRKRWRPLLAYAVVLLAVLLVLFNLVSDALVSRYERTAEREPGTKYLKGMAPRTLGPEDTSRAALFVHGFIGAQSNFNTLPDAVAAAGWHVETMCLPGHGTSPREFERATAEELIAGVRERVVALKTRYETVVIVGHSMGGALTTIVAADTPVDGIVLGAPYFGLTWNHILGIDSGWLVRRAALFIRWVPGRRGHGPVSDPEGRKHIDCYGWIPTAGALTALEIGAKANEPAVLEALEIPVLALHGKKDSVTDPDATARAVEQMVNATVQTHWFEKSEHVLFWDYEKDLVEQEVLQFLEEIGEP